MSHAAVRYGSVVFDCDSTLSAVEGIDELAGPHRAEVEQLTRAAMRGEVPLEDVYGRRLDLISPTLERVTALGDLYVERLVPDAREVVAALRASGIAVRIMSGGLLLPVAAMASTLGVPAADVGAVAIRFDASGAYAGFDRASPLARAGGKREMLMTWRHELPGPIMFVGDGATDLEAAPAADLFVAFAGIADRPSITAQADVVVRAHSLAPILALALGDERPADPNVRELLDQGLALLHPNDRRTRQ